MDLSTILGVTISLLAVVGGFLVEGGHLGSVLQGTAAIIVLGGTAGACFVQFPFDHLKRALHGAVQVIKKPADDLAPLVNELVQFAQKARREGLVSLEDSAEASANAFLRSALRLAVDGCESSALRDTLEVEIARAEDEGERGAKVFEAAGGYAPTVGILGAVLGLIHVMQNLADPGKLGAGIAVAFVATVYGVAAANLLFLPLAGKLKLRHQQAMRRYEIILTGVTAIVDGENPRFIEEKLKSYLPPGAQAAATSAAGSAQEAA